MVQTVLPQVVGEEAGHPGSKGDVDTFLSFASTNSWPYPSVSRNPLTDSNHLNEKFPK